MKTLQASVLILLLHFPIILFGQTREWVSLDARIIDAESGVGIPLVHIQIAGPIGSVSNETGQIQLTIKVGKYRFFLSHLAYESAEYPVTIQSDTLITFTMKRKTVPLEEVQIVGERIQNITPETYTNTSDYQAIGDWLILLGHPGKKAGNWLYLAYSNGTIIDTLQLNHGGQLTRDHLKRIWYLNQDSAWPVKILENRLDLPSPIDTRLYTDSIAPVILSWDDRKFYQSYFGGDPGLKSFYQVPWDKNSYVFSSVFDSIGQYLAMAKYRDDQVRFIADDFEASVQGIARSKGAMGVSGAKSGGAAMSGNTFGSGGSRYIGANTGQPLIYGSGQVGAINVIIPEIKNIQAPIVLWQNMLIQFDFYSGAIYFFNQRLLKIHQVSIDFHHVKQAGGELRKKYKPLPDEENKKMYVWTQRLDQVFLYQLDVETGLLAKRINLDQYKNPRNLQISNGALYFLYDERVYPFYTRLYRLIL